MNAEILTVIGTGVALASFMYTILKNFKSDINERFDTIDQRFEKIEHKFDSEIKEIRTSLNRMEGAFYSKDCCMLKNDGKINKAE